jgi:23S rRNA (guanosine2251-2'-O)-methyltransferase
MPVQTAFGLHAVEEVLKRQPASVQRLLLQHGRNDARMRRLAELAASAGVEAQRLPRAQLDELVEGRHQGAVVEFESAAAQGADLRWSEAQLRTTLAERSQPLVLVLDGVTDPHNLGACLRSADAAGVTAVITPKDNAADITPVVRKVACGATETVPLVRVTNLARCLDNLKEAGLWIYGAAGEAEKRVYDCDLSGPLALVMGAEGRGLRRLTRERCDFLVSLPMAGAVSSLNVSVASGVFLFEAVRQRRPGADA